MKDALLMRYALVPFWYTLHALATSQSQTIVQPLVFESVSIVSVSRRIVFTSCYHRYPNDQNTFAIDRQYLVGRALLVSPNLSPVSACVRVCTSVDHSFLLVCKQNSDMVTMYVPSDVWYEFPRGARVNWSGEFVDVYTPLSKINVYVRGGWIVPMQTPGENLMLGRENAFSLLVASSSSGTASGRLYWDEGESIGE
jgi:alpha-glucosidase (family GH31 glycosyl hydrolase)